MLCQISRTAGTVTYRRSELTGLMLLPFLCPSDYDIEFYFVSPYNVLTGTAMPSKMKGDKILQLLPHIDGFHQSGKTIPKHFFKQGYRKYGFR
jgi:hypothetical protein